MRTVAARAARPTVRVRDDAVGGERSEKTHRTALGSRRKTVDRTDTHTRASNTLAARTAIHRAPVGSTPTESVRTRPERHRRQNRTHKNEDEDRIQLDSEDPIPTPLSSCSTCAPLLPLASPGDPRPLFKYALGGSGLGGVISEHTFWGTSDR
jgi:hypothetical protein